MLMFQALALHQSLQQIASSHIPLFFNFAITTRYYWWNLPNSRFGFFFLFFWDTGERYYQFEDIWFSCLIFTTNQKHNCGVLLQVRNCHLYQGSQTFFGGSPRTVIYRLMTTHHTREQKTFRGQSLCLLTEGEWTSTLERIKRQLVNP